MAPRFYWESDGDSPVPIYREFYIIDTEQDPVSPGYRIDIGKGYKAKIIAIGLTRFWNKENKMSEVDVVPPKEGTKFELGQVLITAGVAKLMGEEGKTDLNLVKFVGDSLNKHRQGDWGEMSKEDKEQNELALKEGMRLMSAYKHTDEWGGKIWIITEANRSATTILLPSEY